MQCFQGLPQTRKKRAFWRFTLLLGFSLPAVGRAADQELHVEKADSGRNADADELIKLEQQRVASTLGDPVDFFDRTTADDCTFFHATGDVQTKASELVHLKSGNLRFYSNDLAEPEARIFGNLGVINGVNTQRGTYNGTDFSARFRFTRVYAKRAGQWQMVSSQSSAIGKPLQVPGPADANIAIQHELKLLERQRAEALVGGDADFLDRTTAERCIFIDAAGALQTKAGELAEIRAGELKWESADIDEVKVRVFGDAAVVNGLTTQRGHSKGSTFRGQYRFTHVFAKREGQWQLVTAHSFQVTQ
jgi:ketosteroid isomerase-like protein